MHSLWPQQLQTATAAGLLFSSLKGALQPSTHRQSSCQSKCHASGHIVNYVPLILYILWGVSMICGTPKWMVDNGKPHFMILDTLRKVTC